MNIAGVETLLADTLAKLPANKRAAIERLKLTQARRNSLLGLCLLEYAMQQQAMSSFQLAQVVFPKKHKPYIAQNIDFSISHSHTLVACAICNHGRIGIDIEYRQRTVNIDRAQLMHPAEAAITTQDFFAYWTQKEAVIKAEGNGGVWQFNEVNLATTEAEFADQCWALTELALPANYSGHIACEYAQPVPPIRFISLSKLQEALYE